MDKFVPITFNEYDIAFVEKQGELRSEKKNKVGRKTQDLNTPKQVLHTMGVYGEYACEKYLSATIDWNIYGNLGDGGKPDGVLPDGRKLLIKSVGAISGVFMPMSYIDKASDTDIVVAIQVIKTEVADNWVFSDFGFWGCLSVLDFKRKARLVNTRNNVCYVVGVSQMDPITVLPNNLVL